MGLQVTAVYDWIPETFIGLVYGDLCADAPWLACIGSRPHVLEPSQCLFGAHASVFAGDAISSLLLHCLGIGVVGVGLTITN